MDQLVSDLKVIIDPYKEWDAAEESLLQVLLRFAAQKILNQRYPYDETVTEVPARYVDLQLRIAVELYSKMGAEGETSHSENGINRAWENADVSKSLLSEITPMVGVIR